MAGRSAPQNYLHQRGLVHRDVKPSNLMRTPEGTVKVLDLGLAHRCVEPEKSHSLTGLWRAMGTPDYLAPEQIENAAEADARADIYGLDAKDVASGLWGLKHLLRQYFCLTR